MNNLLHKSTGLNSGSYDPIFFDRTPIAKVRTGMFFTKCSDIDGNEVDTLVAYEFSETVNDRQLLTYDYRFFSDKPEDAEVAWEVRQAIKEDCNGIETSDASRVTITFNM